MQEITSFKPRTIPMVVVPNKHSKEPAYAADINRDGTCVETVFDKPQAFTGGTFQYTEREVVKEPVLSRAEIVRLAKEHEDQEIIPADKLPEKFVKACEDALVARNEFGFTDRLGLHVRGNLCHLVIFDQETPSQS